MLSLKSVGLHALAFVKPVEAMQAADSCFIRAAQASGAAALQDEAVHDTRVTIANRPILQGKGSSLRAKHKVLCSFSRQGSFGRCGINME